MSTKCSITHVADFHLYNDLLDDEHVFLQLERVDFEVASGSVTVRIPVHIWEYLRRFPGADLSDANVSNDQILREATEAVDSRLVKVASASAEQCSLIEIGGSLVMGGVDLPRDRQIANYVAYREAQRAQKQKVLARVEALKQQ